MGCSATANANVTIGDLKPITAHLKLKNESQVLPRMTTTWCAAVQNQRNLFPSNFQDSFVSRIILAMTEPLCDSSSLSSAARVKVM